MRYCGGKQRSGVICTTTDVVRIREKGAREMARSAHPTSQREVVEEEEPIEKAEINWEGKGRRHGNKQERGEGQRTT